MTQRQISGPKRLNQARFHMGTAITRVMAKEHNLIGKGAKYTCIGSSSLCLWRIVALACSPFSLTAQIIALILVAPIIAAACYAILPTIMAAVWRDTSDYHKRLHQRKLSSYIFEEEYEQEDGEKKVHYIEATKKTMYAFLVGYDDTMPFIAFFFLLFTFIGGWLGGYSLLAGWGKDVSSAFFAGYWGIILVGGLILAPICIYAAIKSPINSGHLEEHSDEWAAHVERCKKAYSISEVKQIVAAQSLGTKTPAGSIKSGNTLPKIGKSYDATAQFRTLPDAVDLEVDRMEDLPGGR